MKTRQMFSVRTAPGQFENETIRVHLCLGKSRAGKSHDHRNIIVVRKLHFKPSVFKFHRFEKRFRKAPFS